MISAIIAAAIGYVAGSSSNSITSEEEAASFDAHWADVAAFFPERKKPRRINLTRTRSGR
jgi:hypothetical protein